MPLEIQRGRSNWFYARVEVNGKSIFANLGIRIEGKVPGSLLAEGDAAFERSRAKAQVALEKFEGDLRARSNAEELLQKILEVRTGGRMRSVPLAKMAAHWFALPRHRALAKRYAAQSVADIERFRGFIAKRHPAVEEMTGVMDYMAREFMAEEELRGLSPKRYTDALEKQPYHVTPHSLHRDRFGLKVSAVLAFRRTVAPKLVHGAPVLLPAQRGNGNRSGPTPRPSLHTRTSSAEMLRCLPASILASLIGPISRKIRSANSLSRQC